MGGSDLPMEEIAWRAGWIDDQKLKSAVEENRKNGYGVSLRSIMKLLSF